MLLARFEFKPEEAEKFTWAEGQLVVEALFDDAKDIIRFCREIEDSLVDCMVFTGSDVISLRSISAQDASA